jgi:hypothetical protein
MGAIHFLNVGSNQNAKMIEHLKLTAFNLRVLATPILAICLGLYCWANCLRTCHLQLSTLSGSTALQGNHYSGIRYYRN